MKALPHCDVPRAICTTEGKDLDKEAFSCFCKPGFTGANSDCTGEGSSLRSMSNTLRAGQEPSSSGIICIVRFSDIDECVDADANKCSKDALCINTAGTYECRCKDGFIGDGFICSGTYCCELTFYVINKIVESRGYPMSHHVFLESG